MRLKQLWTYFNLPAYIKLVYARLTARPIIVAYLLLTLFRFGEVGFQVKSLASHFQDIKFFTFIIGPLNISEPYPLAVLNPDKSLQLCTDTTQSSCETVFSPDAPSVQAMPPNISLAQFMPWPSRTNTKFPPWLLSLQTDADGTFKNVTVFPFHPKGPNRSKHNDGDDDDDDDKHDKHDDDKDNGPSNGQNSTNANISSRDLESFKEKNFSADASFTFTDACLKSYIWMIQMETYALKEDLTYVAFEIWLVMMAVVAVLNESIPHMIASLAVQLLATIWNGYHIIQIGMLASDIRRVIVRGTCAQIGGPNGLTLGQMKFDKNSDKFVQQSVMQKSSQEIPVFLYNCISLIIACYLTPKVINHFRKRTAERMGDSPSVHRSYKAVLTFSVFLQASTFFFLAPVAVWVGLVFHGPLSQMADHKAAYQALSTITFILIGPWLVLGWVAVRRESRRMLAIFVVLSVFFNLSWTGMFISKLYRRIFTTWQFFGLLTIFGSVVTMIVTACAIWCRINFNKGLAERLQIQETPDEGVHFDPASPDDEEKARPPPAYYGYQSDVKIPYPSTALVSRIDDSVPKHEGRTYVTSTGRVLIDLPIDDVPPPQSRMERTKQQVASRIGIMPRTKGHARRPS